MLDNVKLNGEITVTLTDIRTGEKEIHNFKNLIVTVGHNQVAALISGQSATTFNFIGVGSSNQTPAKSDTDLITAVGSRNTCTSRQQIQNTAIFSTLFATTDANGTWREAGLFTASSGGTMLCRALFTYAITKDTNKTATIEWIVTIT